MERENLFSSSGKLLHANRTRKRILFLSCFIPPMKCKSTKFTIDLCEIGGGHEYGLYCIQGNKLSSCYPITMNKYDIELVDRHQKGSSTTSAYRR